MSKRPLIFTFVPIEIEEHILDFYYKQRDSINNTLKNEISDDKLINELLRRTKTHRCLNREIDFYNEPTINGMPTIIENQIPNMYQRDMFRLYRMTIREINDSGIHHTNTDGHSLINLSYMFNHALNDKIATVNMFSKFDIVFFIDETCDTILSKTHDMYDTMFVDYWMRINIEQKHHLAELHFNKIKEFFFHENGLIHIKNKQESLSNSAYRVLRLSFINDRYRTLFK